MTPSSAQYSCSAVTRSLFSPLFFSLPIVSADFLSCTTQWLPSLTWKKRSFLSIISQYFLLNMPLDERSSCCMVHTPFYTSHISGWITDSVWLECLLPADCSAPTNTMIRSFITPPLHACTQTFSFSAFFYLFFPSSQNITFLSF